MKWRVHCHIINDGWWWWCLSQGGLSQLASSERQSTLHRSPDHQQPYKLTTLNNFKSPPNHTCTLRDCAREPQYSDQACGEHGNPTQKAPRLDLNREPVLIITPGRWFKQKKWWKMIASGPRADLWGTLKSFICTHRVDSAASSQSSKTWEDQPLAEPEHTRTANKTARGDPQKYRISAFNSNYETICKVKFLKSKAASALKWTVLSSI